MSALVVYGVSTGLVHVKTIAIFVTHVQCAQARNEVRWPRGKKKVWRPMFEPEVFRNQINCIEKCTGDIVGIFRHLPQ